MTWLSRPWRIAIGLALLLALLAVLDVRQIVAVMRSMNGYWALAAAGLMCVATVIGAGALYLLLNTERVLSFRSFLPLYWTAWAVGMVFPGQVGDMVSITVVLQRRGMAPAVTLGRTIADKLVSLLLMMAFALWAVRQRISPLLFAALVLGALLVGVLLLMLLRPGGPLARHRLAQFLGKALREALTVGRRYPGLIAINFALTSVKICLNGLAYWCMFQAFGFHAAPAWDVVTLVAVSSLVAYIPISFNGVGTAEVAGVALFATVGVTPPAVLASYLVLRAIGLSLAWIPAAGWWLARRDA